MKTLSFFAIIAVLFLNNSCSDSTTATSSSSDVPTDSTSAVASIPSSDPSTMDYAINSSSSVRRDVKKESFLNEARAIGGGGSTTILAKITHTRGAGLGTFEISQCINGSFMGKATYSYANGAYTGSSRFRYGDYSTDIDLSKTAGVAITDSTFDGSVDIKFNSLARLTVAADGETDVNSLKGTKAGTAISCKWNGTLGCAKVQGGSAIPYAVSVNSSTKAKTYSASSDESLCTGLDFATVAANETLTGTWDCSLPSGSSWIEPSGLTAPTLEDKGGASCKTASDIWESSSTDPSSCGAGTSATSIGCFCDALHGLAIQETRRAYRMLECKAKGLFKLVKDGELSGVSITESGSIYVKISLGSR